MKIIIIQLEYKLVEIFQTVGQKEKGREKREQRRKDRGSKNRPTHTKQRGA